MDVARLLAFVLPYPFCLLSYAKRNEDEPDDLSPRPRNSSAFLSGDGTYMEIVRAFFDSETSIMFRVARRSVDVPSRVLGKRN